VRTVRYLSTRGQAEVLDFEGALLAGLARDGGLYLPETWPQLSAAELESFVDMPYAAVAARVMQRFVGGTFGEAEFAAICREAYGAFDHPAVTPLVQLGPGEHALELFHGPTLAFKDVALQLLGRLFDAALTRSRGRITIVGATSGDTGSAAIEGCRGRDAIDIFILFPKGRTSEVQRRQMTTVPDANVHCIAIEGTFDDCQALVKAMFNDAAFRDRMRLSAVNSINWARVMAQIVYYIVAGVTLGAPHRRIAFSVPTGNFGDVLAGYAAMRMGLPVERLIVASNRNDILTRFFETGTYRVEGVAPTMSPSMDIQVSSNFERLLFEATGRDGGRVRGLMASLQQSGGFTATPGELDACRAGFAAARVSEEDCAATIRDTVRRTGWLPDPHTAIGLAAAARVARAPGTPLVTLATAHPAKFPDAVEAAAGRRAALPPRLADLYERPERFATLANDLAAVQAYIQGHARLG